MTWQRIQSSARYPCMKSKSDIKHTKMARWSSGQDAALSRRKQGFDSPTSCDCLFIKNSPTQKMLNY